MIFPLSSLAATFALAALGPAQTLPLAGRWQFALDPEATLGVASPLGDTIVLPTTTDAAHKGTFQPPDGGGMEAHPAVSVHGGRLVSPVGRRSGGVEGQAALAHAGAHEGDDRLHRRDFERRAERTVHGATVRSRTSRAGAAHRRVARRQSPFQLARPGHREPHAGGEHPDELERRARPHRDRPVRLRRGHDLAGRLASQVPGAGEPRRRRSRSVLIVRAFDGGRLVAQAKRHGRGDPGLRSEREAMGRVLAQALPPRSDRGRRDVDGRGRPARVCGEGRVAPHQRPPNVHSGQARRVRVPAHRPSSPGPRRMGSLFQSLQAVRHQSHSLPLVVPAGGGVRSRRSPRRLSSAGASVLGRSGQAGRRVISRRRRKAHPAGLRQPSFVRDAEPRQRILGRSGATTPDGRRAPSRRSVATLRPRARTPNRGTRTSSRGTTTA